MARTLNALAKRVYALAPDPVVLTFADGRTGTFEPRSAEFFRERFQCEATAPDDPGARYRFVTEDGRLLAGRRGPDSEAWASYGDVTAVDAA